MSTHLHTIYTINSFGRSTKTKNKKTEEKGKNMLQRILFIEKMQKYIWKNKNNHIHTITDMYNIKQTPKCHTHTHTHTNDINS